MAKMNCGHRVFHGEDGTYPEECPTCGGFVPNRIHITRGGMLPGTMGEATAATGQRLRLAEVEFVGALMVRWHHVHNPETWVGVSREDLIRLMVEDEVVRKWASNPFWRPDSHLFEKMGYVTGWIPGDLESKGILTDKFHKDIRKASK